MREARAPDHALRRVLAPEHAVHGIEQRLAVDGVGSGISALVASTARATRGVRGGSMNQSPKTRLVRAAVLGPLPVGVVGLQCREERRHGTQARSRRPQIADAQLIGLELLVARVALDDRLGAQRGGLAQALAAQPAPSAPPT